MRDVFMALFQPTLRALRDLVGMWLFCIGGGGFLACLALAGRGMIGYNLFLVILLLVCVVIFLIGLAASTRPNFRDDRGFVDRLRERRSGRGFFGQD